MSGALALTDDPCLITGAQGVGVVDHSTYEMMMREASWEILDVEIADDVQVRVLNDSSVGAAPIRMASCSRAVSSPALAICPKRCTLEALPGRSRSAAAMASMTS